MKRIAFFAGLAIAVALNVGCANNRKDAAAASASRYKILTGSTSEASSSSNSSSRDEFDRGSEPQVQPDTHFAAGQLSEVEGHLDCALTQYEQALRLNPNHVPSLYRMGVVLTKTQKYEQAVATWQRYVTATGNIASSYSNLGFCYEMAGDVENAEKSYLQGISIDAKSQPCHINYGLMLARQNRSDEAEVELASVLKPAEVSYNLASVYEQQGAMARAKEELEKALAANPNMTEAQNKLANLPQD